MSKSSSSRRLVITGHSGDDVVAFAGSISDELYPHNGSALLTLPDGTEIKTFRDEAGVWRAAINEDRGGYPVSLEKGEAESDASDVLTVDAHVPYVIWQSGGSKNLVGDIALDDEKQEKLFARLKEVFDGSDEWLENETLVKGLLTEKI